MTPVSSPNLSVGKFLISPLVQRDASGGFSASVSIRTGRGSQTHDRVLRLIGRFLSPETARHHAVAEGIDYIRPRFGLAGLPTPILQGAE